MIRVYWYAFWLRVLYWCRLRWPLIALQRRIVREHKEPRASMPDFERPRDVLRYVSKRFRYRRDETRLGGLLLPLDWVTHHEVFQHRLEAGEQRSGDCDDYHNYIGHVIETIEGVDRVYLLSTGYKGGGHMACVFRQNGRWFLFNYSITMLDDPNDAPGIVAKFGAGEGEEPHWYVFETVSPRWKAAAISPTKLSA